MFQEFSAFNDERCLALLSIDIDILDVLLGKSVRELTTDQMETIWLISGKNISEMYSYNLRKKEGIG